MLLFLIVTMIFSQNVHSSELTVSVKGQQFGTIEIYTISFATDSLFKRPLKTFYCSSPSKSEGALDFPYRATLGGYNRACHLGNFQTEEFPAGTAKLTFADNVLRKGSVYYVKIVYSKFSAQLDKLRLSFNGVEFFSFAPENQGSWEAFTSYVVKVRIN